MILGHIKRGTILSVFEELEQRAVSEEYEAIFRYVDSGKQFVVQSAELYESFDSMEKGVRLNFSFVVNPYTYTFTARAIEKQRSSGMVLVEQLADIETISRRKYDRDEFRFNVRVFGLPEAKAGATKFEKPEVQPDISDVTYDLSAGGMCVISNTLLSSKHDPNYLIEFELSDKDLFLLPAKLVRRSNYARAKVGRYDYGFQFAFDNIPDEKGRLSRAILSRKLLHR